LAVKNAELEQTTTAKKLTAQVIAKIKARLFTLAGVADTDAPNLNKLTHMPRRRRRRPEFVRRLFWRF